MRSTLALALAFSLSVPLQSSVAWASTVELAQEQDSAKQLYDEGRKAFRLGRYGEAVGKFEEAYAASDNAVLLYNIGLAYWRWYGVSKDIEHLRKAKAVLQNYVLEAQRDPERLGDPAEQILQIKEIDLELQQAEEKLRKEEEEAAAAEERERAQQAAAQEAKQEQPAAPKGPVGPDPGRGLKIGGGVLMGVGAAGAVAGTIAGAVFALKGSDFEAQLQDKYDEQDELGCDPDAGDEDGECGQINDTIEVLRSNGELANTLTIVSFVGMGVGVAALGTGVALFIVGRKRTAKWKAGQAFQFDIAPTARGFMVRGQF